MKVELKCMYWENSEHLIKSHKKVTEYFELPTIYEKTTKPHGLWMDETLENSSADIVGFFDSDCIPLNKNIVEYAISYTATTKSFIGNAQCSNHIRPKAHIFAAPSFFFIWRDTWKILGKPSFSETPRSDVGQEVSYIAESKNIYYKALYPTHFEREPVEGAWRMGNYGYYGVGTVFAGSVYHLFQGRLGNNALLFKERCEQVIEGTFSTKTMHSSVNLYQGRICNFG